MLYLNVLILVSHVIQKALKINIFQVQTIGYIKRELSVNQEKHTNHLLQKDIIGFH